MGRKKFIDKKNAVTFQLLARDSSDPNYNDSPGGDRVFVRIDNNPISGNSFFGGEDYPDGDSDAMFADAPEDDGGSVGGYGNPLPESVRKEILELGFPDDGYNYLLHLREIRNTGGGSAFYQNPKAKLDQLPRDVKAYDASRVEISPKKDDADYKLIHSVASRTFNVRVQKAVDPDVAALLDDSDVSKFDSDDEDLEEDFVIQANRPEEGEGFDMDRKLKLAEKPETSHKKIDESLDEVRDRYEGKEDDLHGTKPRVRRLLDEQFDMLELKEYGSDSDDNVDDFDAETADEGEEEYEEPLARRLKNVLNENPEDFELDDKYQGPGDLLHKSECVKNKEILDSAAEIIRRCAEYAERYEDGNEDVVEVVEESSDESEVWDCETIISTYSNLDNHPGKIQAPGIARKKKLSERLAGALSSNEKMISLKGKEKLPVDFLPSRKPEYVTEKAKGELKNEQLKRKAHGQESKEEKKERKAAVKEERREARRMKKEMKGLYRCEAQRAQRAVAVSGPSSIHLM